MFIFSCYAGGFRFSDVVILQWKHYDENEQRIRLNIRKTKRSHQFKVDQSALETLNIYRKETSKPDDFIFSIISEAIFFEQSNEYQLKVIGSKNVLCGQKLRIIGKELGFTFL